jgi:hypothetical protein
VELCHRRPGPEPAPVRDLEELESGLEDERVGDRRIVPLIRELFDAQILLDDPIGVRQGPPPAGLIGELVVGKRLAFTDVAAHVASQLNSLRSENPTGVKQIFKSVAHFARSQILKHPAAVVHRVSTRTT